MPTNLTKQALVLLDSRNRERLRAELADAYGLEVGRGILAQMGYVQGYRDGLWSVGLLEEPDASRLPSRSALFAIPVPLVRLVPDPQPKVGPSLIAEAFFVRACKPSGLFSPLEAFGCAALAGYASGFYSALFREDLLAKEVACRASGHSDCRFMLRLRRCWEEKPDPAVLAIAPFLHPQKVREEVIEEFRQTVDERPGIGSAADERSLALAIYPLDELPDADPETASVGVLIVSLDTSSAEETDALDYLRHLLDGYWALGVDCLLAGGPPGIREALALAGIDRKAAWHFSDLGDAVFTALRLLAGRARNVDTLH